MGLFCLATKNNLEDDVKTAIGNLELFLHENSKNIQYEHLLDFAKYNIENAKKRLDNNDATDK